MTLYHRLGDFNQQIRFDPVEHRQLAEEAVIDVVGELGRTISDRKAEQVRERWQELIEQETTK